MKVKASLGSNRSFTSNAISHFNVCKWAWLHFDPCTIFADIRQLWRRLAPVTAVCVCERRISLFQRPLIIMLCLRDMRSPLPPPPHFPTSIYSQTCLQGMSPYHWENISIYIGQIFLRHRLIVGGRSSPEVVCWTSDHWVAGSNPPQGHH